MQNYTDGIVQDYSISITNPPEMMHALGILQSCTNHQYTMYAFKSFLVSLMLDPTWD